MGVAKRSKRPQVSLLKNIAAYDARRGELEDKHPGKWAVFHNCELVGLYDAFNDAARDALRKFERDSYLIRQIGVKQVVLPIVMAM